MSSAAVQRPRGVAIVLGIWCIMVIIGIVSGMAYTNHTHVVQSISHELPQLQTVRYVLLAFTIVLNCSFAYMAFLGHNWARVALLVLFALGAISLPSYLGAADLAVQAKAISGICLLVQLAVLVVLFTGQCNVWFRRTPA